MDKHEPSYYYIQYAGRIGQNIRNTHNALCQFTHIHIIFVGVSDDGRVSNYYIFHPRAVPLLVSTIRLLSYEVGGGGGGGEKMKD